MGQEKAANCCHCEFYVSLKNREDCNIGKCVKNAPVGETVSLDQADKSVDFIYIFPLVLSFNHCGEFKKAPEPSLVGCDIDGEQKLDTFLDGLEKKRQGK